MVQGVCQLLGITKLNTTGYVPQACNEILAISGIAVYLMSCGHIETPHTLYEATKKPSYLLFGTDCHFPSEAAFQPINPIEY